MVEFSKQLQKADEEANIKVVTAVSKIKAAQKVYTKLALGGGRSNKLCFDFKLERVSVSPKKEKKVPIPISSIAAETVVASEVRTNCRETGTPSSSSRQWMTR